MYRYLYPLLSSVFFVLFLLVACTLAQKRAITDAELISARQNAFKKAEEANCRVVSTDKEFSNGVLKKTDQYVWEYAGSDRSRRYHHSDVGGKISEGETIRIGTTIYERENGGPWQKQDVTALGYGSGGSGTVKELTQTTKEHVDFNGKPATLYEDFRVEQQVDSLIYYKSQVWIDDSGFLLRRESSSGSLSPFTVNHQSESAYTYDPKIKVEAPIK